MKLFVLLGVLFLGSFAVSDENNANSTRSRGVLRSFRRRFSTTTASPEITIVEVKDTTTEQFQSTTMPTTTSTETATTEETTREMDKQEKRWKSKLVNCGERVGKDLPWIAVIEHRDPSLENSRKTLSKGVLISDQHVLTTVSSIHNTNPFWVASAVRLGDLPTWVSEEVERNFDAILTVDVDTVYKHKTKDIAIIKLVEKVNFTDSIQPICLPYNDNYNFPELWLHICKRVKKSPLREVELSQAIPVSPQDCNNIFTRRNAQFADGQFCAWDNFGDTCTGDIGGPLMTDFYVKFIVIGLNSYALAEEEFDATGLPGIYVNVGKYLDWIETVLKL